MQKHAMQNWAKNYTYQANGIETPETVGEVAAIVVANPRVRALGSRHCFNDIADAPGGVLVSLERLNRLISIDSNPSHPTVTVEGGITYGQLGPRLHAAGFALANLASLPHISVAGAVATGTHGSGERNGCLSTSIAAMQFIDGDGKIRTLARGDPDFAGAVVHLGTLGIVTKLTLDLVPTFEISQRVYDRVPMAAFVEWLDPIVASAYSVSGFTDWQSDSFTQVWMKSLATEGFFDLREIGGVPANRNRHPLEGRSGNVASEGSGAEACTLQMGESGAWHERLPHFRMEFTPSSGEELQSEYFVARKNAGRALAAIRTLHEQIDPLLQISEVRFIAADKLWLSPCYDRPSVSLHFTWHKNQPAVEALLPEIERVLEPFEARPHWGKVFTMSGENLQRLYPKIDAFRELRARYDVKGKFDNPFVNRLIHR